MFPLCKILMLLAVPARLMKFLYSRDISVRHSIEVKEAVNIFQVSQIYNDAIEDMRIETTLLDS